jgi:hypothetical protein
MYSSAVVRLKGVSRRSRRDPFGRCLRQNPQLVVRQDLASEVSFSCAPRGSRTPNPQIRSLMLYPIELWVRFNCRVKIVDCRSRVLCVLLCFEGIGREPRRKAGSLERSHCLCARRESPAGVPSAEPPTSNSTELSERSEAKFNVELRIPTLSVETSAKPICLVRPEGVPRRGLFGRTPNFQFDRTWRAK